MIRNVIKSYKSDNRGSAIITGLVVSAVLMVLCLSLLLVAYSLFLSASNATSDMPNKEMLYSAADVIGDEITSQTVDVTSYTVITEDTDAEGQDTTTTTIAPSALWDIIYQGISTEAWPYYKKGVDGHSDLDACSKYYQMTSIGSVKIIVQLYWEPPKEWTGDYTQLNGALLNAVYRLCNNDGEVVVKAEKKFILESNIITSSSSGSSSTNTLTINDLLDLEQYNYVSLYDDNQNIIIEVCCDYDGESNSMARFRIDIINNTGHEISDWYVIIVTNNTIRRVDDGEAILLPSEEGLNRYKLINSNRSLKSGRNGSVLGFSTNEKSTKFPIVFEFNSIVNPNYLSSETQSQYTTWKWNPIG